jgi:hypothetical protein
MIENKVIEWVYSGMIWDFHGDVNIDDWVVASFIILAVCPVSSDDGGSTFLWNTGTQPEYLIA